jgi:hypothetical protein
MLEKKYINDSESDGYSQDYTDFDEEFETTSCCYWYYLCCCLYS